MRKAKRLKPLELGDVMVALINQDSHEDHISYYKSLLGHRWDPQDGQMEEPDTLWLPEFATADLSQAEILDYHIKNKITDTSSNERALAKLDSRIKNAMEEYSGKLKEGQLSIQDLMGELTITCQAVSQQRKYLTACVDRVRKGYAKIGPAVHKINNIKKVLEIMTIWGKAKLPYLLSIDADHPHQYDLMDVLGLIESAQQMISSSGDSSALKTMLVSLELKKSNLIKGVCTNLTESIVRFTNVSQYRHKYQQYLQIREMGLCRDVMTGPGLSEILKLNAHSMFYEILRRFSPNLNLDLLNETAYLEFFDEVIEEYVIYFRSWHLVTAFHIDSNTPYGRLFLQHRREALFALTQQLSNCFENSNKFIALEYRVKLQLVEKLQDYMEAGEKWMGKCEDVTLPKVVTAKLKKELENVFNLYNNLIKNVLTQELSVMALENADSEAKPTKVEIVYDVEAINYTKICQFLNSANNPQSRVPLVQSNPLPSPPFVRLKIGSMFVEMIAEYLERAKYLEADKSIYINKIIEHFEFIMFILYQVAVRDSVKELINDNVALKLQELSRNDEPNLKQINELARAVVSRRKYFPVLEFMGGIGRKYDGIRVAGIIDVNKVFGSGDANIISGYTKLAIRVVSDLTSILNWLQEALPQSALKGHRRLGEIGRTKNVLELIFELILDNNMEAMSVKYVEAMSGIMGKLKWEIKKFNQETALAYKEYKMKALELFRNNTFLFVVKSEAPHLEVLVQEKEVQTLYRSMLECYGRIDKINDNGRQLVRMDSLEITKILQEIGVNCSSWATWFEKYLDFTCERNYRQVLEKVSKVGLLYPPLCWKYHIMWVVDDISFREKKDYYSQLSRIYLHHLKENT